MAGHEDEAQQVVAHVVVELGVDVALSRTELQLDLPGELLLLALERRAAPQQVDRAVLRRGHEPGARVVRHARLGPLLERGDESVLRELLGEARRRARSA